MKGDIFRFLQRAVRKLLDCWLAASLRYDKISIPLQHDFAASLAGHFCAALNNKMSLIPVLASSADYSFCDDASRCECDCASVDALLQCGDSTLLMTNYGIEANLGWREGYYR